jgi:2,5-diamino-6-(ribosylamino)-4(3H)-pyrimidinone 5'-phosphate reductase
MLPYIILHNVVSLDGRIDGFNPNIGLYYQLASRWQVDAALAGSNTILNMPDEVPPEDESAFQSPEVDPNDSRPVLVIPDSRGRVRHWHYLRQTPFWKDMIALCSQSTPDEYFQYLTERHIDYITTGDDHVDIKAALEKLYAIFNIKVIRVDSGGTLNGILLRQGLVNEISVLIEPYLVGGDTAKSIFHEEDLKTPGGVINLKLTHHEKLEDQIIWLKYEVLK